MVDDILAHGPEELQAIELLSELQKILTDALNSLGENAPASAETRYLGNIAILINQASDGYLALRKSQRVAASKLLIRPVLEATFSGMAAIKKDGFLFRKAYSEWEEEKKLYATEPGADGRAQLALEELKKTFLTDRPDYPIECKKVNARETAGFSGQLAWYDTAYRLYCKFTHGAMRAVLGEFDNATDQIDTKIMIWCLQMVLDELEAHTPAQIPDLSRFRSDLDKFSSQISQN